MSGDEIPTVQKIGVVMNVSKEMLVAPLMPAVWFENDLLRAMGLPPVPDGLTDEQRAERTAERLATAAAARDAILREHQRQLAATESDMLRAVLALHGPTFGSDWDRRGTCEGCDMAGYECEPPEFPCRTYELITKPTN